jgi:hypothetical protein
VEIRTTSAVRWDGIVEQSAAIRVPTLGDFPVDYSGADRQYFPNVATE